MTRTRTTAFVILMLVIGGCAAAPPAAPTSTVAPSAATAAPTGAPAGAAIVATPPVAAAAVVEVTIEGFAFKPPTVKVAPGTTVRWTQKDAAPHTVTSDKGVFDSKNLDQGQSLSFKFDVAGKNDYICAYHPSMKGTVEVQ